MKNEEAVMQVGASQKKLIIRISKLAERKEFYQELNDRFHLGNKAAQKSRCLLIKSLIKRGALAVRKGGRLKLTMAGENIYLKHLSDNTDLPAPGTFIPVARPWL